MGYIIMIMILIKSNHWSSYSLVILVLWEKIWFCFFMEPSKCAPFELTQFCQHKINLFMPMALNSFKAFCSVCKYFKALSNDKQWWHGQLPVFLQVRLLLCIGQLIVLNCWWPAATFMNNIQPNIHAIFL